MDKGVRFGVVGTGVFGNYHANKCADNPMIDFIGVYDLDEISARNTAAKHSAVVFEHYQELLTQVDAVIIACAAQDHGVMAVQALEAGCHCLIEKPLAADLTTAKEILELSAQGTTIVQAGHQERFVMKAIGLHNVPERPKAIYASRLSPYSLRGTDVSVTLDLMSHDLDLVLWLMGEFPQNVSAKTETLKSSTIDRVFARLEFINGYAELSSSRVADASERIMELRYPSGTVHIDFNKKALQHDTPFDLDFNFSDNPVARDSLGAATQSFVQSILHGGPIAITAQDGYDAVRLAVLIDEANT